MTLINEILRNTLNQIIPTNQELKLINEIVEKLKHLLKSKAEELNIKYTLIESQGSTGIKQTQLKGDFDIDLFIGLDYNLYKPTYEGLSKNKLKKESKKDFLELCNNWIIKSLTLKNFQNPRLLYAEHPYVTVDYILNNIKIKIDIVLYFDLDKKFIELRGPITAVDRSPWHGRFIRENLTTEQKNDVRLLKQFFKSCHCYGDASAVGKVGFIGYSAELLIYYFGTIQKLFRNFHTLKEKPLDYYKRNISELKKIQHFQNDYLIIIDPIDKNRNVASAISGRAYIFCNEKVKKFLKKPSKEFFMLKAIPEADLSNIKDHLLSKISIVELKNNNKEIHYTINRDKLYSLAESIKVNGEREFTHAERFGNIIYEIYFEDEVEKYNIAIYCQKPQISNAYIRRGPPIKEKLHADKFKEKNPEYFEKSGYLWVETKREFCQFSEFLKDFIKNKIPDNFSINNFSISLKCKSSSGKKTIYILKEMILPFYI
jgi:tRNA nucleotidyltransferase (CCA-adding enzyme)